MKLQQLRFLVAVINSGLNITAAAEALFTSQPGVSKQIRLLEDELGLKLFVRRGKRLESLTPAGEQIAARAERVLREVEHMKAMAGDLRGEQAGEIRLATTQTQARYVLPQVIDAFRRQFPDVDFHLHQGTSEQIGRMIAERQVEFALLSGRSDAFTTLVTLPIYQWDRVILVPEDHPLAAAESPDLEALARYPLVTYLFSDRPESSLMSAFTEHGLTPRIAFTARDADIIKTYVRMGLGVGVLASMAVEPDADDDLVAVDASDLFARLTTWLGFPEDLLLKRYHCNFIRLLAPHLDDGLLDDLCRRQPQADIHRRLAGVELPLLTGPAGSGRQSG
ncbi:MAG: LysR family transcriptional regulator [Pseudomonadota bacterium]|nr:MAG: LysR family transcriptional regulator [Pseudomonadota bacterium]